MRKTAAFVSLLIFLGAVYTKSYSQQTALGINIIAEKSASSNIIPSPGISYEIFISKHSSVEVGANYRTVVLNVEKCYVYSVYNPYSINSLGYDGITNSSATEHFVSIPMLGNFKTKYVNFSIGYSLDIYLGADNIDKYTIGVMGKIGTTIHLTKHLILEPDIRYNPIISYDKNYYGLSLAAKYAFNIFK